MSLANINWRSPITWVVIIGGGVAVYFLFRYFQSQNQQSSTNATPSVPAVGTSLYLTTPPTARNDAAADAASTTGTTGTSGSTPGPISYPGGSTIPAGGTTITTGGSLDMEHIVLQEYGFAPNSPASNAAIAVLNAANPGRNFANPENKPAGAFLVPQVDPTSGMNTDFVKASGGGVPDTSNFKHLSTWPYGGQKVTSRLG